MMKRIKPCPFCGNRADAVEEAVMYAPIMQAVECGKCQARGPDKGTEEEAVAAWNDRI